MKGLSTIDHDTIRKHQANSSTSKNSYQFSKEKRFPGPNPEYLYHHVDAKLLSTATIVNSPTGRHLLAMAGNQTSPKT